MDDINIVSKFITKIVSGIIAKALEKQLGCKINLEFNEIKIKFDGNRALAHFDLNAEIRTADIMKLTSRVM